ncbi:exodeoxyribonuclease VII large subunit [Pseudogemmobacter humi]|uniref:Exodeoxyribonuclease 7 large subunit n=1 Tax=Pseudogemmobacter humi TaxID=2483812 RepID=A0A3P5XED0_9RHOB|nr:exodeoxyribonuclease VII large subunit [Pseudogemmobacter humi]VDC33145.1 Exodeoxyribonuclease 7 large subunit [Pseudogemmobacter humi]
MDLFEDTPAPQGNSPEFTVSELSGAVKRVIEGEFGLVRVRGEIGRVSRPASGHLYYDLKDDRSVIAAITWKGQAARLSVRPEEGMEVVATGRMTTFPGQSKYQLIVEDLAPAGAGALMAMLEKRRAALSAEGLFDPARKKPIPWLPGVIGVVTSPSGAVIRDILHRLRDRFPRRVLIWPVAVQGERCAPEVAAAIRGFNAIAPGGPVPRPDLLIVARGGGSLEDLWGFNEEVVVRAAAESRIPLISAVGHETDTTLIDLAADLRAPTPTAAAELAVPVRMELLAALDGLSARLLRGTVQAVAQRRQRLADLSRALPRPEALTGSAAQRLDHAAGRLGAALGLMVARRRGQFDRASAHMRPELLLRLIRERQAALDRRALAAEQWTARRIERQRGAFANWSSRLEPALHRLIAEAARRGQDGRLRLAGLEARLEAAADARRHRLAERIAGVERVLQSLGYENTLRRGYAVVRGGGRVLTSAADAGRAAELEIQFADGRLAALPVTRPATPARRKDQEGGGQGSLF